MNRYHLKAMARQWLRVGGHWLQGQVRGGAAERAEETKHVRLVLRREYVLERLDALKKVKWSIGESLRIPVLQVISKVDAGVGEEAH